MKSLLADDLVVQNQKSPMYSDDNDDRMIFEEELRMQQQVQPDSEEDWGEDEEIDYK